MSFQRSIICAVAYATLSLTIVRAVDRTGSFSTQPYVANPIMNFEGFDFYGEGITYDSARDQVLVGTLSNAASSVSGKIYAVPYVNPVLFGNDDDDDEENGVVYEEDDMVLVFDGDESILSIAGLEMDPSNPDVVWAATGQFPATATSPCGVAQIDISSGALLQHIDLSDYRSASSGVCMSNDLVFDDAGDVYVTDFYGYQVLKIAVVTDSNSVSVVSDDITYLCNENSGVCPPEEQQLYSTNGPNGIEYVNGRLIVAVSADRMVWIDLANTSYPEIISQFPADGVQGCDGKENMYYIKAIRSEVYLI